MFVVRMDCFKTIIAIIIVFARLRQRYFELKIVITFVVRMHQSSFELKIVIIFVVRIDCFELKIIVMFVVRMDCFKTLIAIIIVVARLRQRCCRIQLREQSPSAAAARP